MGLRLEVYFYSKFPQPIIMYATIGHELYHSLFISSSPLLLAVYAHRGECVKNHYRKTCDNYKVVIFLFFSLFFKIFLTISLQGECSSGEYTFTEDGADLEGLRITHEILKQIYSNEQLVSLSSNITYTKPHKSVKDEHSLQNKVVNGLETTLEQAFFYYAASEFCSQTVQELTCRVQNTVVVSCNLFSNRVERYYSK